MWVAARSPPAPTCCCPPGTPPCRHIPGLRATPSGRSMRSLADCCCQRTLCTTWVASRRFLALREARPVGEPTLQDALERPLLPQLVELSVGSVAQRIVVHAERPGELVVVEERPDA